MDNEIKLNVVLNHISNIIYTSNYDKLRYCEREEIKKYIGYVGNIIDNYDKYENNNDYKQLNSKHVSRYLIQIKNDIINFDSTMQNIINFIKMIYNIDLMKHKDIIYLVDKYEVNNYQLNVLLYKTYDKYIKDIDNFKNNILKIKKCIEYILDNNKSKFKELIYQFDNLYG